MRMVHTSDWHLGRTLHGVDLLDHQATFLDHLAELVRAEDVCAVLVCGDVYDRPVPPLEAVQLLADALARLSEHAAVVVIPGNHDSAIRLGFGAALMRDGVHLRARVADVGTPVELVDDDGPVVIHALPYLDPDGVRRQLADDQAPDGLLPRSHQAVVGAAMRRVRADLAGRASASGRWPRSVVMAHAFVVGGLASDSERDIRVGGVDSVPVGVFAGVDYGALGHLHGPQEIRFLPGSASDLGTGPLPRSPVLRYSGSPLAYSFSEMHHHKSTALVDMGPGGVAGVELVPVPVPRRLSEVTGTLADLLGVAGEPFVDDWVRAVVTDRARPPDLHARLKGRFTHLLVTEHRPVQVPGVVRAAVVTSTRDPVEVAAEFVEHVTGGAPTPDERAVLQRAYDGALAAERSA